MTDLWNIYSAAAEYDSAPRDKYGRYQRYMVGNRNVFEPVVSDFLVKELGKPVYPDGHSFALCLSHDVDHLQLKKSNKVKRISTAKALAAVNLRKAKQAWNEQRILNPDWTLDRTVSIESKYNAKSSFYFLALEEGEQDFNYRLSEITEQFKIVRDAGGEIGLHGGHGAHENSSVLKLHKERLEKVTTMSINGYRGHFLRFSTPSTWNLLKEAGFSYDSTLGFSDCAGFRNGICHPFYPWDRNKNAFIDIVELPLALMDVTLTHHMHLSILQAKEFGSGMIDTIKGLGGAATLLWHNNNMEGEMGKLYEDLLAHAHRSGAWVVTGEQLSAWWNSSDWGKAAKDVLKRIKQ